VPAVPVCATKLDWPASASLIVSAPLASVVPSSVTLPVSGPPITGASPWPITVITRLAVEVAP
jgi:hypothetical protein